jgi:hypothetical protein
MVWKYAPFLYFGSSFLRRHTSGPFAEKQVDGALPRPASVRKKFFPPLTGVGAGLHAA